MAVSVQRVDRPILAFAVELFIRGTLQTQL